MTTAVVVICRNFNHRYHEIVSFFDGVVTSAMNCDVSSVYFWCPSGNEVDWLRLAR